MRRGGYFGKRQRKLKVSRKGRISRKGSARERSIAFSSCKRAKKTANGRDEATKVA